MTPPCTLREEPVWTDEGEHLGYDDLPGPSLPSWVWALLIILALLGLWAIIEGVVSLAS